MVSFVIFWSATFAIIFFVLGIIFKALASAFKALLTSLGMMIGIGGLVGLAVLALVLLYNVIDGIIKDGFWSVVGEIVFIIVMLGIVGAWIGGLGVLILETVVLIADNIITITSAVLEWAAYLCERLYARFLTAIIVRLDKC